MNGSTKDYIREILGLQSEQLPRERDSIIYSPFPRGFNVTEEDEERFLSFIDQGKVLDRLAHTVAPSVIGMRSHKKAVLLALASLQDWGEWKNRLHVLFYGPTGTAKTQLALSVLRLGGGWAASRTTKVGLTASGQGKEVEPGLLPVNNGGAVGIDELDKFPREDQAGCLNAMEEGVVPIHVGKHHETMAAEVIVIGTANEPDRLLPELMDRFDFVLETPEPTIGEAYQILQYQARIWGKDRHRTNDFGKYLTWIREFEPSLDQAAREELIVQGTEFLPRIARRGRVRVRRLEGLIRTALAHARIYHRNVSDEDVEMAAQLLQELDQRP